MMATIETLHLHTEQALRAPKLGKLHERMAATRQAGLAQAIPESNKGFQLLRKSGYDGGGLGRNRNGIDSPIAVHIRSSKAGLGVPAAQPSSAAVEQRAAALATQKAVEVQAAAHSKAVSKIYDERLQAKRLADALACLEELDASGGEGGSEFMWASRQLQPAGQAGPIAANVSIDEHRDTVCGCSSGASGTAPPPHSAASAPGGGVQLMHHQERCRTRRPGRRVCGGIP